MSKYIPADKLIAEIKEWRNKQIGFAWDAVNEVLKIVSSIQQEQPEVDFDIKQELYHHFGQVKDFTLGVAIARHFYELGQRTQYQKDRGEFAKLKAKEWQEGYDEGYERGRLNARKED